MFVQEFGWSFSITTFTWVWYTTFSDVLNTLLVHNLLAPWKFTQIPRAF